MAAVADQPSRGSSVVPEDSSSIRAAGLARDGAWRPWAIWAIGAAFFFLSFFTRVAPSVMVGELMRDFAVGAAVLGNISAFYLYAYAGMQIPVGMTLDRFGPRRMMTLAAATAAVGCLTFGLAPTVPVAGIGRTLIGLGCSFAWIGSMKLIAIWFPPERFAQVMGMTSMIGMLGGAAGQSPVAAAVDAFGWRATQVGAALATAAVAVVLWLVVRDRRAGGAPAVQNRFSFRAAAGVVRMPQTWIAGVVIATSGAVSMAFVGLWSVPFLVEAYGMPRTTAAFASSLYLIGWAFGAPVVGWLSDHFRTRRIPILAGGFLCFASVLTLVYVPGLPAWAVYPLLLSCGVGGCGSIIGFAVIREINRAEDAATAMGVANLLPMALSALLQPVIGWILDTQWTGRWSDGAKVYDAAAFRFAFLTLVACAVATVVCGLLIRETHARSQVRD